MRILVTGATGFIGNRLANALVAAGHEVRTTGVDGENPFHISKAYLGNIIGDIAESRLLKGVEAVFHQAANNDPQDTNLHRMFKANVSNTADLFEWLYKWGCRTFIYASSTAVYGSEPSPYIEGITKENPLTPYAYSKLAMEHYVAVLSKVHADAKFLGLRYCNVYGPGEAHKGKRASMIHQMIKALKAGEKVRLFKDGQQARDWVHVDDVVQANLKALDSNFSNEIVNIGSGGHVTFNHLFDTISAMLCVESDIEYIDNSYESTYQTLTQCDIQKARKLLGYEPIFGTHAGLKHYIENWS